MPVVVIAITVVVRCEVVNEKYPGGMAAFKQDVPNNTFSTDGELAAASFMNPRDVGHFIYQVLQSKGLKFHDEEGKCFDIVVVDQNQGPTCPTGDCAWIKFGKQGAVSFCWTGTDDPSGSSLCGPSWWTPEKSASMNFIPQEVLDSGKLTVKVRKEDDSEE